MEKITKQTKPRKLTKKQRGFVRDYAIDENGTQAVLKNYKVKDSIVAKSIASENLTKPYLLEAVNAERETLRSALEKQGITPTRIAERVDVLLNAKDKEGISDYTAIDKGLKHATAIYGVVDEPTKNPSINTYNFIFSPEVKGEVKKLEDSIKEKLLNHVPKN